MTVSNHNALCVVCDVPIQLPKKLFCSQKCRSKKQSNTVYRNQQKRGLARKLKLIKMKGGECQLCGYKKCVAALHFHHLRDKVFQLDIRSCSNRTWKVLEEEVAKCLLLCANCHAEVHHGDALSLLL